MSQSTGTSRKSVLSIVLLALCIAAIAPMLLSGPCDLLNRAAVAAAYNFRATTAVYTGDVVIWDTTTAYGVKTTNVADANTVAGVSTQTVSAGNDCTIRQDGGRVTVNVTGTVTKGQWLTTSTTTGKAKGVSSLQAGIFGYALTDSGTPAAGQVYASINLGLLKQSGGGDMFKATYDPAADGDIDVAAGGTGKSSWTQYAIPYLSDSTTFGEIGIGAAGQHLAVNSGANGYEWVSAAGSGGTGYIPFELRLGVPDLNLSVIDFRQAWASGAFRTYGKRVGLSGTNTSSDLYLMVQLPGDFSSFGTGTYNMFVIVWASDSVNNSLSFTVLDSAGDPDNGVNAAVHTFAASSAWETFQDKVTEVDYSAGDWVIVKMSVNLDANDQFLFGEGWFEYVKN